MKTALLPLDQITVLPFVERPTSRVADDLLRKSIAIGGIQQPLVAIVDGERYLLAEGSRRLRVARALGLGKVPVVLDTAPTGVDPEEHARRIRFVLDEHRQDLLPSQKAELIGILKERFSMTNSQVASYLGIASDSVTNWMAVTRYIPAVVAAMDAGALTMQAARVFDGMTEQGQKAVWRAHGKELTNQSGAGAHKRLRAQYPPANFPTYYRDAAQTARRLAKAKKGRKAQPRTGITPQEKRRLVNSFELREIELREGQAELATLKGQIQAAIAPVAAILRSDTLKAMVPAEMREELERFSEVYV